jgi:hypothetical protein
MKRAPAPATPIPEHPTSVATLSQHTMAAIVHHGENILAEIPKTLRRVATLFLVLSISIPVFFAALIVVLWHLAR